MNWLARYLDARRVARHRERCRREAQTRLAEDVQRRKQTFETRDFAKRRAAALKHTRGELA